MVLKVQRKDYVSNITVCREVKGLHKWKTDSMFSNDTNEVEKSEKNRKEK